jgi:hypothetical protein
MATDFEALGSALYTALGGTAGTVYYALAPQDTPPPYVVFARDSAQDEYMFGADLVIDATYVVKAVSNRQWPHEAYARYDTAHTLIQNKALSVTGYTALRCVRQVTLEYQDSERYWHVGGVYRIEIDKT